MSRAVGILGGMGPVATVDFMGRLVAATPANGDGDHLRLFVDCNPQVLDRNAALAGKGDSPGPDLVAMAQGLERQGADFLVIACNSAHAWADEIIANVAIPLVSMIDATVEAIARDHSGLVRVGLLAADACLQAELYQSPLVAAGLDVLLPDTDGQKTLMALIYGVKAGDTGAEAKARLVLLVDGLVRRGAQIVVVACTEVPMLLAPIDCPVPLVDSTGALVTATLCAATR
jgi:aspartate racemase